MILYWIIYPLTAYIIGSIPFGLLLCKARLGIDIRKQGSGNIGATNVTRAMGLRWGIITFFLDALKGFLPVFVTSYFFDLESLFILTGLFAILGHIFPIFLKLRGGKGVATTIGVYLSIAPIPLLLGLMIFVVIVMISDFISLGSMSLAIAIPLLLIIFGYDEAVVLGSIVIALLILFKHRDNIWRLSKGKEGQWRKGGSLE